MWYSTNFDGVLYFKTPVANNDLAFLNTILWADVREHPEWNDVNNLTRIDLELLEDFSGIKWDWSEKTYDMEEKIKLIIRLMRERDAHFMLSGILSAQWEEPDDRYDIVVEGGNIYRKEYKLVWIVQCPHCWESFNPKEEQDEN